MKNLKKLLTVLLIVSMTLTTQGTYVLAENVEKVFETHDNIVHENYGIEAENNLLVVSDNIHETQDENMKKESSSDEEKDLITGTSENVIPSENDNIEEDDVKDENSEKVSEEETSTDAIETINLNEDIISESETSEDIALDEDTSNSSNGDSIIESENVISEKEIEIVDEEKKATVSDTENVDKEDEINIYDIVESTTSETDNILLMGEEEKKSTVSEIDLDELEIYKNKTLGNIDDDYVAPIAKQSMLFGAGEIPSRWDSREHCNETTGLSYVPPVRNQNPYGICWSFATTGMFETSIRKKGLVKNEKESNLSELALAYFMYNLKGVTSDPNYCGKPGLEGDDYTILNEAYFIEKGEPDDANWHDGGGNQALSTKMLTSFVGMIVEDDLTEYTTDGELNDAMKNMEADGLPKEYAFNKSAYVPKNIKYINRENRDQIKQAIMENGSVGFSYFAEGNDGLATHWDENGSYYHSNGRTSTNHAIMIVGWDDNIDAQKFYYGGAGPTDLHYETIEGEKVIVGTNPPTEEEYEASTNKSTSNGAWLARNSWDTTPYFLKEGYFYIPYDEPSLSDTFFSVDAVSADTYKYNYHYDTTGINGSLERNLFGNIFKVSGEDENQLIEAVNIGVDQSDAEYDIKIYTNDSQMNTPVDGTLVKTLRGSNELAGFYTFEFDSPIELKKDTYFSVVVEAVNNGTVKIFADNIRTSETAFYHAYNEIAEKQSFMKRPTTAWSDLANSTSTTIDGKKYGYAMRIKAYGSAAVDVSFNYNGKGSDYSETHKKGDTITKPEDPTYEGYKFVHWYKEGTSEDTAFDFSKAISEEDGSSIVLMAKWEPITYTIAYDIGGVTFATKPADINHEYGTSISLSDPSAIADGYRFAGWFTDTDYDDTHKYVGGDDNELSTTDGATVSLYAKWEVRTSYNANGRGTAPATSWSLLNENITLPTIADVEGYKFDTINSWYDGSDISTANLIGAAGGTYKVIESKELFANWVKLGTTKTITFNDNYSGATYEQEFTVGADTAIRTDVFTRSGYTFVGWKDKSGVAYTNTKELTDDIILYAEWQQNPAPYVPSGNDGGSSSSSSSSGSSSSGSSTGGPIPQNQINQQVVGQETAKETLVSTSQSEQIVLNAVGSQWLYDPLSSSWKLNALDLTGAPAVVANGFFILNQVTLVNENNNLVPKNVQDTYYFDAVGNMVTGWVKTNDNKWYFFDNAKTINEGKLCIGWKQIGSDWYCFSSIDGSMLSNTVTADGYKLGSDGKWIP